MEERTKTTATVGNGGGGGGGSGEKRGMLSCSPPRSTPRVGKKPGDSHSFGANDWILFDEAAPRTVQSSVSPANTGHAHLPLRTPYPSGSAPCTFARTPFPARRPARPFAHPLPPALPRLLSFGG